MKPNPNLPDMDSEEFQDLMIEAWDEANKYSYEGTFGARNPRRSDKAQVENLIHESRETRVKFLVQAAIAIYLRDFHKTSGIVKLVVLGDHLEIKVDPGMPKNEIRAVDKNGAIIGCMKFGGKDGQA